MANTAKLFYNVGQYTIDGVAKNVYLCNSGGQQFLAYRKGDNYVYLPYDAAMSGVTNKTIILDRRTPYTALDNSATNEYSTPDATSGLRFVSMSNTNSKTVENYANVPYYSITGEGVDAVSPTNPADSSLYLVAADVSTQNQNAVAATVTGIGFIDAIIAFIMANLIVVAIAGGLFIWFDPFGWFGKKKGKGKGKNKGGR